MKNRPALDLDVFEERLLAELTTVVKTQGVVPGPAPARRSRYLPVVAAACAVVAAAMVGVLLRPTPAYAISGGNGREITVKVARLEGAQALEEALRDRGVAADIIYLPPGKTCRPGRYTEVDRPGLLLSVAMDTFEVTIPAGAVGGTETFVLSAAVEPLSQNSFQVVVDLGVAQGAVGPCQAVDAA